HSATDLGQQDVDWHQLTLDRQRIQQRLFQWRGPSQLLLQQLADAIEKGAAGGQKGADVAAKKLTNRPLHQHQGQWVSAVQVRERLYFGRRATNVLCFEDGLTDAIGKAEKWQYAHRRSPACEWTEFGEFLAAGHEHTALVLARAERLEELG